MSGSSLSIPACSGSFGSAPTDPIHNDNANDDCDNHLDSNADNGAANSSLEADDDSHFDEECSEEGEDLDDDDYIDIDIPESEKRVQLLFEEPDGERFTHCIRHSTPPPLPRPTAAPATPRHRNPGSFKEPTYVPKITAKMQGKFVEMKLDEWMSKFAPGEDMTATQLEKVKGVGKNELDMDYADIPESAIYPVLVRVILLSTASYSVD